MRASTAAWLAAGLLAAGVGCTADQEIPTRQAEAAPERLTEAAPERPTEASPERPTEASPEHPTEGFPHRSVQGVSDMLAFERDFFVYPALRRRNPFDPPADSASAVPLTGLSLLGIVRAQDPSRAVVLLATTRGEAGHGTNGAGVRTIRLRSGEQAGNLRVVEVGVDRAVVVVREPGNRERSAELALPRRRQSGAAGDGS